MEEFRLVEIWNVKRTQVINAQMAPTLVLIAVLVLAALGYFDSAPNSAKYLAIGVSAATGVLALISQYATIREAQRLVVDLDNLERPSELSKKIAASGSFLSLVALALVLISIGIFALVVWAVLG
jgi:hypothetical protein